MPIFQAHFNLMGVSQFPNNPGNMIDGDTGTFATAGGWEDPAEQYVFFDTGILPTTPDIITLVETRIYISRSTFDPWNWLSLQPADLPLGDGDQIDLLPITGGTATWTPWQDITATANAGTWTWSSIQNMGMIIRSDMSCTSCSPFGVTRVSSIELRVTYDAAAKIVVRDTADNIIGEYPYFEDELSANPKALVFPLTFVGNDIDKIEIVGQEKFALNGIQFGDKFPDISPELNDTNEIGTVSQKAKDGGFGGAASGRYSADFDDDVDASIVVTGSPIFAFPPGSDFIFTTDIKWNAFSGFQKYSLMYNFQDLDNYWMFTFNTHGLLTGGTPYVRHRVGGTTLISLEPIGPMLDYELGTWYNIAFMRKAGLLYYHRNGHPISSYGVANNSDFPAWGDIKVGATLVDHYTHTWYGEDFELDNVKIYNETQTFDPLGYDWWTGQYFDDTRFEACSPATCGYWEDGGWHSTDTAAPFYGIRIMSYGPWEVGYRPTKIRFEWDGVDGGPVPVTLWVVIYDKGLNGTMGYNGAYTPGDEIELDWTGLGDGFDINFSGGNIAPWKLTNIEFVA